MMVIVSCDKAKVYSADLVSARFCRPQGSAKDALKFGIRQYGNEEWFNDVVEAKWVILSSVLIAFVLSFLYLWMLEQFVLPLIIICIGLFTLGMGALSVFCYLEYRDLQTDDNPANDDERFYLYASITVGIFMLLFLCLICCIWDRITLASQIIQATCDYITDVPYIVMLPVLFFVLLVAYIIYWAYSGAYIFSVGETYWNPNLPWGSIKWSTNTK